MLIDSGRPVARLALATGLAIVLVWPAAARAQTPPACAEASMLSVTLASQERGESVPPVATHELDVTASFSGSATRVVLKPPPDVRVTSRSSGGEAVALLAPNAASLPITVTWRQAADPANPDADPDDPSTQCAASRVVTLALLAARASRAVKHSTWRQSQRLGQADFAIVPAATRPDLSPIEISSRTTSSVRFPSARDAERKMTVPLRSAEQVKYATELPNTAYMGPRQGCRFYYLSCSTPWAPGGAFVVVSSLFLDLKTMQGDVDGALTLLARTQPNLRAARYGVHVEARPGGVRAGKPRRFGYDVQVRQSGRLIARVRRAGRCDERRRAQGLVVTCRIARTSTELH